MIKGKNFKGEDTPRLIDTEYYQCNFIMRQPNEKAGKKVGVRLFPGDDTPRTFIDCNLINREVPPGSTIKGGNTAIIEYDVVMNTDEVEIDGDIISSDEISNFVHGRYNPETLKAEYKNSPEEIPQPRKRK